MNYKKSEDIFIQQSTDEVILFIHGIFASHVQFEPLIKSFTDKDYSIYAVALKGHGQTYKAFKKVNYRDWMNQIDQILEKLTSEYKKVYVISHSLGTLLTINSKHINNVTKAVLLAPAIKPKVSFRSIRLALRTNKPSKKDYYIQNQKIQGIEFKHYYHKVFAVKPLIELLKIIRVTKKQISNYKVNTLIVISKNDETVRFSSGQYVFDHINSQQKELIVLNKSFHGIFDKEEESVLYDRIIEFIIENNQII